MSGGQIFHVENWSIYFWDTNLISNLRVWVITQPVGNFIIADETNVYKLNGLVVRVLLEVDLRSSLKKILVVNDDEECPLLLSYEKLFEACFYCGMRMTDKHACPADYDNDGYLLVDRILEDEMLVCPSDFPVSDETKSELHDGVILLFPQPSLLDKFGSADRETLIRGENVQEHMRRKKTETQFLLEEAEVLIEAEVQLIGMAKVMRML